MEPIKVQVSVELNFSEDAKKFITSLVSNLSIPAAPAAPAVPAAPAAKPVAPAAPKPTAPAAPKPAPTAQVAPKPAAPKPVENENQGISIDDVRKALALKVADHRPEIKAKLEELGAVSVTKLDESKYPEMLDFLNTL